MKTNEAHQILAKAMTKRELRAFGFLKPDGLESFLRRFEIGLQECMAVCFDILEQGDINYPRKIMEMRLDDGYMATRKSMNKAASILGIAKPKTEPQGGSPMSWHDKVNRMLRDNAITPERAEELKEMFDG